MRLTFAGLDFLKSSESCSLEAYKDQAGIPTIGYGTIRYMDGSKVKMGDIITPLEAELLLEMECNSLVSKLNIILLRELNINQFNAIVSLVYNIGINGFKTSTLLKFINSGKLITIDLFTRWNKIHRDGMLLASKGLTSRRKREFKLYVKEAI